MCEDNNYIQQLPMFEDNNYIQQLPRDIYLEIANNLCYIDLQALTIAWPSLKLKKLIPEQYYNFEEIVKKHLKQYFCNPDLFLTILKFTNHYISGSFLLNCMYSNYGSTYQSNKIHNDLDIYTMSSSFGVISTKPSLTDKPHVFVNLQIVDTLDNLTNLTYQMNRLFLCILNLLHYEEIDKQSTYDYHSECNLPLYCKKFVEHKLKYPVDIKTLAEFFQNELTHIMPPNIETKINEIINNWYDLSNDLSLDKSLNMKKNYIIKEYFIMAILNIIPKQSKNHELAYMMSQKLEIRENENNKIDYVILDRRHNNQEFYDNENFPGYRANNVLEFIDKCFDIDICKNVFDGKKLYIKDLYGLFTKTSNYMHNKKTKLEISEKRILKYQERGFTLNLAE